MKYSFISNINIIICLLLLFLFKSNSQAEIFINYGETKSKNTKKIYLTIDMCPSNKSGYDKELFNSIIFLSKKYKTTIPVAIAVSGYWILNHINELKEIKQLEKDGYILITWVNHSYKHYYNQNKGIADNFMLYNEIIEAKKDIKKNYDLMIENNLVPSNFFRFPALVSDNYLNSVVEEMGLIPLGAESWLAKTNGKFQGGDIILVHGNLNEKLGVNLFIKNVKNNTFDNFEFASILDFEIKKHFFLYHNYIN